MLNLKSFKKFLGKGIATINTVVGDITRKISSLFSSKLKKAKPGDEVQLTIPSKQNVTIKEGELQVIQGNYNEALVLLYLYTITIDGVAIAERYKKYLNPIKKNASKWLKDLKGKVKNWKKSLPVIEQGSKDMVRYLANEAIKNDSIIVGGYLDNLSFQRGGIESKADIQIFVEKEGKEQLIGYSLKLYSTKSVGLANTTAVGLAKHLGGDKIGQKVEDAINKDSRLNAMIEKAALLNKTKQALKRIKRGDEEGGIRLLTKYGYSEEEIKKLDIGKIDAERNEARKPINPRIAEVVFKELKPIAKTEEFGQRLLKVLGFTDKDTKMLMSVATDKKHIILDKHPDLDVSNIDLKLVGVQIKVVGPTGKPIVVFGAKEGEKKAFSGKVSFAGVDEYDLANTPVFGEI